MKAERVTCVLSKHAQIQGGGGGGGGGGNRWKNHKNMGFPTSICLDPLKITKILSQHSMLGHHRHASKKPEKKKKNPVKVGPPPT